MTFKYRDHRGGLDESMETVQEFESKDDLVTYLQTIIDRYNLGLNCSDIIIKHYCYDDRIDWDCHIVTLEGWGPFGFTDKQIEG